MIRYIDLRNYRCFTNLHFDFMSKNGIPLKFVVLYGENGSGKSNLLKVFELLYDSFQTMNIRKAMMKIFEQHPEPEYKNNLSTTNYYTDITRIIQNNKTICSSGNMVIDIGFQLDGKNGSYVIEFDSDKIVYEKLEYTLTKNRGVYFELSQDQFKINDLIFNDFRSDLLYILKRYWGKHSAIALLNNAREDFSDIFFEESVSSSFISVLDYLNSLYIYLADNTSMNGIIESNNTLLLENFVSGTIPESNAHKLDATELVIKKYLKSIYRDITDVFYKKEHGENSIKYNLYFKKLISNEERTIPYSDESCGTQNLLYLLPFFISSTKNHVVAIDEIDNGIHDILFLNLINAVHKSINGQLIISTHNTMLLNEYDFKDSFFFIEVDDRGNRNINSPSDYGYRIQPDSNVAAIYLKGRFKGIPWSEMNIDFQDIANVENTAF